jgi:hypothetical protein
LIRYASWRSRRLDMRIYSAARAALNIRISKLRGVQDDVLHCIYDVLHCKKKKCLYIYKKIFFDMLRGVQDDWICVYTVQHVDSMCVYTVQHCIYAYPIAYRAYISIGGAYVSIRQHAYIQCSTCCTVYTHFEASWRPRRRAALYIRRAALY